jgi:hypothetical protein
VRREASFFFRSLILTNRCYQALFELRGNKMTPPVETVKKFIRPLVDKAYKRQSTRPAANPIEPRGSLLDHLINSLDSSIEILTLKPSSRMF